MTALFQRSPARANGSEPFLASFAERVRRSEPEWLQQKRRASIERFAELGLPTTSQEAWRFTDLKPLREGGFEPLMGMSHAADAAPLVERATIAGGTLCRLVFLDGNLEPTLSVLPALPGGVWLGGLRDAVEQRPDLARAALEIGAETSLALLTGALFTDGPVLDVPAGVSVDLTIQIIHVGHSAGRPARHLRGLFRLGAGARASVVETFAEPGESWTNSAARVEVADNAELRRLVISASDAAGCRTSFEAVGIGRDARYDGFLLTLGSRLARMDVHARIEGENGFCGISGLYLLRERQDCTAATVIEHKAPRTTTREVFKGVVGDRGHGVFQGKIHVHQVAQKTSAYQLSRSLLLGERAVVDAKPELEIYADDVKCSHGATVGDLDEDALFYLQSRGVPAHEARAMLIEGFTEEAVELIADPAARAHAEAIVRHWLVMGKAEPTEAA